MTYVITQSCCNDASCVPVCPVDCIRPVGETGEPSDTGMLYIDAVTCIDCGACVDVCPVDAIYYEDELPPELEQFKHINASYFEHNPLTMGPKRTDITHPSIAPGALRVAIVGAGPAACYAAAELSRVAGVEVDVFDRLATPFGLVRTGVAPDHQNTKSVVNVFDPAFGNPRVHCHLNVEVGETITHDDLLRHHHAVIYAVGAPEGRDLGIPGERLAGSHSAADFVGWYNGHPDHADCTFDLCTDRVVIIGNGNVALDVARIVLISPEDLTQTDIAQHALEQLSDNAVREVLILARRGIRESAFSVGEFLALGHLKGVDVVIDSDELDPHPGDDVETALKLEIARDFAARSPQPDNKRIVFRFGTTPVEVLGDGHAESLRVTSADGDGAVIDTRLILRSIGQRGVPINGMPFDQERGVVPNEHGRVVGDGGDPIPGVYVTGWIKRGPRGVIGTNRGCAEQTVEKLWEDFDAGVLDRRVADRDTLVALLAERGAESVDWQGWRAIDAAERERGRDASRPRVKFVERAEMLSVVSGAGGVK